MRRTKSDNNLLCICDDKFLTKQNLWTQIESRYFNGPLDTVGQSLTRSISTVLYATLLANIRKKNIMQISEKRGAEMRHCRNSIWLRIFASRLQNSVNKLIRIWTPEHNDESFLQRFYSSHFSAFCLNFWNELFFNPIDFFQVKIISKINFEIRNESQEAALIKMEISKRKFKRCNNLWHWKTFW